MKTLVALLAALLLSGCGLFGPEPWPVGTVEGRVTFYYWYGAGWNVLGIPDRNFEVLVWVYDYGDDQSWSGPRPRGEVGVGGRYRVENVPAGVYNVGAYPSEDVPEDCRPSSFEGFVGYEEDVVVNADAVTALDFAVDASHLRGGCFDWYWD